MYQLELSREKNHTVFKRYFTSTESYKVVAEGIASKVAKEMKKYIDEKEINFAIDMMRKNNHDFANFGMNGTFLYSKDTRRA